jgi:hypothetical protein
VRLGLRLESGGLYTYPSRSRAADMPGVGQSQQINLDGT